MKVRIRMNSAEEEEKALPLLLRHSPGRILRDGTYVLSPEAVGVLRDAGIKFIELSPEDSESA
jgi:hypothetical protein